MSINTKLLLNKLEENSSTVKVLEPFSPTIIKCDDKDAFNVIYNSNKEKYDAMTTQKLNKLFDVPGYKITRVNNQICLRSIKPCEKVNSVDSDMIQKLVTKIEKLEKNIALIADAHNKLNDDYNQLVSQLYRK